MPKTIEPTESRNEPRIRPTSVWGRFAGASAWFAVAGTGAASPSRDAGEEVSVIAYPFRYAGPMVSVRAATQHG